MGGSGRRAGGAAVAPTLLLDDVLDLAGGAELHLVVGVLVLLELLLERLLARQQLQQRHAERPPVTRVQVLVTLDHLG